MPVRIAVALCIVMVVVLLVAGCTEHQSSGAKKVNGKAPTTLEKSDKCPIREDPDSIASGDEFTYHSMLHNNSPIGYDKYSFTHVWLFGLGTAQEIDAEMGLSWAEKSKYTLPSVATRGLKNGTYYVVFQHPNSCFLNDPQEPHGWYNNITYTVASNAKNPDLVLNGKGDVVLNLSEVRYGRVNGKDAADILEKAISMDDNNNPAVERTTLNITEAWFQSNPIPDVRIGDILTISGTTNVIPGNIIDLYFYSPIDENFSRSGWGESTRVTEGTCGISTWSLDENTSQMQAGVFTVIIERGVEFQTAIKQNFTLIKT